MVWSGFDQAHYDNQTITSLTPKQTPFIIRGDTVDQTPHRLQPTFSKIILLSEVVDTSLPLFGAPENVIVVDVLLLLAFLAVVWEGC